MGTLKFQNTLYGKVAGYAGLFDSYVNPGTVIYEGNNNAFSPLLFPISQIEALDENTVSGYSTAFEEYSESGINANNWHTAGVEIFNTSIGKCSIVFSKEYGFENGITMYTVVYNSKDYPNKWHSFGYNRWRGDTLTDSYNLMPEWIFLFAADAGSNSYYGYWRMQNADGTYLNDYNGGLNNIRGVFDSADVVAEYPDPDPYPKPGNPYEPGGFSKPGELPPGTFDSTSDSIPDSALPTISAANTGFTRIYNPTLVQVQDLARYLWTDETVVQTIWNHIKQYFEDPMQAIIGFNLVPCSVPNAGTQNFALMYIDTGVSMNVAANQFVDVDCGSVKLERFYGSALDQSPHTRVSCFLPYIGTIRLNTDEVMGTTLEVKYRIDICSGSCVAKILVDGNCLYQYSGHCAINIPISSADFSSYVSSAITVARLATGAAVGGVAGLSAAAVSDPEQQTDRVVTVDRTTTTTERNPATGRQITTGTRHTLETKTIPMKQSHTQASFNALSPENVSNTVGQIMSSKPLIEHTGSFSGNTGYLGVRRPFLIIERPNMCMPEQYQHFNGFPSMITMELSTCEGFTRIQQVELTGMTATNPEQAEILSLLKSGVYF